MLEYLDLTRTRVKVENSWREWNGSATNGKDWYFQILEAEKIKH